MRNAIAEELDVLGWGDGTISKEPQGQTPAKPVVTLVCGALSAPVSAPGTRLVRMAKAAFRAQNRAVSITASAGYMAIPMTR